MMALCAVSLLFRLQSTPASGMGRCLVPTKRYQNHLPPVCTKLNIEFHVGVKVTTMQPVELGIFLRHR